MTDRSSLLRSLHVASVLILLAALLAVLPQPSAAAEAPAQKICIADPVTGEIDSVLARRDPDSVLRRLGKEPSELKIDPRLEARNTDWYKAGERIVWNGKTYRAGGEWRESALRRYLRHQGIYRGVPMMSLWPGGDRTLAMLVEQETCTFRGYEPEGDKLPAG